MKTTLHTNLKSISGLCVLAIFLVKVSFAQIVWTEPNLLASANAGLMALDVDSDSNIEKSDKIRRDFLSIGMELYEQTEWEAAEIVMTKYLENFSMQTRRGQRALFHLALCNFNTSNYQKAASLFQKLLEMNLFENAIRQEAEYHHATIVLQFNTQEGRDYMEKIANDVDHPYDKIARGILKMI